LGLVRDLASKFTGDSSSFKFNPYPMKHFYALNLPTVWDKKLDGIEGSLRHRAEIVNELMATETAYIQDLGVIIGVCIWWAL
jgi:hypothetical protein